MKRALLVCALLVGAGLAQAQSAAPPLVPVASPFPRHAPAAKAVVS